MESSGLDWTVEFTMEFEEPVDLKDKLVSRANNSAPFSRRLSKELAILCRKGVKSSSRSLDRAAINRNIGSKDSLPLGCNLERRRVTISSLCKIICGNVGTNGKISS
ncbi:DEAD-box ATP-dependent RNA helicase 13 [Dorcoceras hygrometricum]|uniref:DEAD-box ATP-dependent RNA helicase 13 n=1 Tax=Dorcoceras hygrometricum TaxID=472368 RepID=A0A2Z7BPU9_9LAMI|nr:DEAD-box ATP-dependent RNA helicase 13 [Dorcoceras hygrometricum]